MKKVAVIGAGQMGSGIGQLFAMHGFTVQLMDVSSAILEKAKSNIKRSLHKLLDGDIQQINDTIQRISYHMTLEELRECDIFIESAFEDFNIKSDILSQLSYLIDQTAYVASNTSACSISELAHHISHPERFIGFHFMNPPVIMQLVEVIRGEYTSDKTFEFFWELAQCIEKKPIASKNSPGFVLNRILIPMINEAAHVLYEGVACAQDIDAAMKLGANHPIGPLALADLIGLDTTLAILKRLYKELNDCKYAPCPLLEEIVAKGHLGRKTGKGFYEYSEKK